MKFYAVQIPEEADNRLAAAQYGILFLYAESPQEALSQVQEKYPSIELSEREVEEISHGYLLPMGWY